MLLYRLRFNYNFGREITANYFLGLLYLLCGVVMELLSEVVDSSMCITCQLTRLGESYFYWDSISRLSAEPHYSVLRVFEEMGF